MCSVGGPIGLSEMKLISLYALLGPVTILLLTALAAVTAWGLVGLTTNNPWYNTLGGIVILIGCFFMIVPVMALAGSLVQKQAVAHNAGSFPVTGITFVVLVVSTVLIVGALTFFPALALSPIVGHILMHTAPTVF